MISKTIGFFDEKITDKNIEKNIPKLTCISLILLLVFSFPLNLYSEPMTENIVQSVFADELPVKIDQNRNSETWILPTGEFVSKIGGEAKTSFFDNNTNTWVADKVTALSVNSFKVQSGLISTIFADDIIHYDMNMTNQVSKEKSVLLHKVDKNYVEVPLVFVERTLNIVTEPSFESVSDYIVNDEITVMNVLERYSTSFGDFFIKYTYKDSKPLKHTFTLPSSPLNDGETFAFAHDFELLNYNNNVLKNDEVFVKDALTKEEIISDSEKIENQIEDGIIPDIVDSQKIRIVETETNELVKELLSDEVLTIDKTTLEKTDAGNNFTKVTITDSGNNFLLGEIIAETKDAPSWEKFKEVTMDNTQTNPHVKFVYGDWIGGFELDPDTYSSNNPTLDGYITSTTGVGESCSTTGNTINSGNIQTYVDPTGAIQCNRGFAEFDISSIPNGVSVIDSDFGFDLETVNNPRNCDFIGMSVQPSVGTADAIYDNILSATTLLDNDSTCTTTANNKSVDLGSSGDTYFTNQLTLDWASIGIRFDNETKDTNTRYIVILEEEDVGATPKPTLTIMYVLPINVLTVDVNENDTSTAITGNVNISNSTLSQIYPLNSTGNAIITGLAGNHNLTVYDSNNFITNRTLNFNVTANETKSFDTDIFRVSCGSGNDVIIKTNETNAHYKSTHSTPECYGGNTLIWNSTFTSLGNYTSIASNFTSSLIATVLDLTNFNANATSFLINGSSGLWTYSNPTITSQAFNIANGTNSVFLNFELTLGSTPAVPVDGGSSGGGGGGGGITSTVANGILLNLNSKSFSLSLGEKRTYPLDLIWDETKEFSLFVKSITISGTGLNSLSVQPEILPVDGKKIINGKGEVLFSIDVPLERCDDIQQTARCVYVKTYAVPVMVTVSDILGTVYPDIPAVLTITITDKFPVGFWIIGVLLVSVTYPIYRIMKEASKKDKRPKPKDIEKNHKKAMKQIHKNDMKNVKHNNSIFKRLKS